MQQERNVVIVGGGTMGCDVAAIFHAAGWPIQIVEPAAASRDLLPARIQAAARAIGASPATAPRAPLAALRDIQWQGVALVIECAPETLALKQAIFAELEGLSPAHVPLTSNSSSLPISAIGEGLRTRDRMIGLHFFMPAHLVPAVEVVRSEYSSEAVVARVTDIMKQVRKKPVQVKRDVPGFLANRIQHAMMREAIALVEEGFASAEDVDVAVRYGFGFRLIAAGPLLQKDLAGIDIHCAAATTMYPHLRNDARPSALMRKLVEQGDIGVKSLGKKGFYEWDDAAIARERQRYELALKKAWQILKDEDDAM
ncbi:NAD-binding protein [Achromobacter deleyi]|nr:NAD-binding protein [Achromobacter deleyi]